MTAVTAAKDKDGVKVIRATATLKSADEAADFINLIKAVSDGMFDKEIVFPGGDVADTEPNGKHRKLGIV